MLRKLGTTTRTSAATWPPASSRRSPSSASRRRSASAFPSARPRPSVNSLRLSSEPWYPLWRRGRNGNRSQSAEVGGYHSRQSPARRQAPASVETRQLHRANALVELHWLERAGDIPARQHSDERMPFMCNSASRSILAKRSVSWALSGRYGSLTGAVRGSGVLACAPSTETTGRVETLTVPR